MKWRAEKWQKVPVQNSFPPSSFALVLTVFGSKLIHAAIPGRRSNSLSSSPASSVHASMPNQHEPSLDDIQVEHHPSTKRATQVYAFESYKEEREDFDPTSIDERPWRPFRTHADFEFAELAHETAMSNA